MLTERQMAAFFLLVSFGVAYSLYLILREIERARVSIIEAIRGEGDRQQDKRTRQIVEEYHSRIDQELKRREKESLGK